MKRLALLTLALFQFFTFSPFHLLSFTMAQTDITSQYVKNPSFEMGDITTLPKDNTRGAYTASAVVNWVLSGSYGVSDIMTASATATDNNFGAPGQPSDGTQMYYIRNAWSASNASLTQSVQLAAGTYKLTVDNKCITASSHTAKLIAGANETTLTFHSSMPDKWQGAGQDRLSGR